MIRLVVYLHREHIQLFTIVEANFHRRVCAPKQFRCSEALLSNRNEVVLFGET